jgi:hypothetical protein
VGSDRAPGDEPEGRAAESIAKKPAPRPGRNNGYVNEIKKELSAAENEYDFFS